MAFHKLYNTKLYRALKRDVVKKNPDAWPEIGRALVVAYDSGMVLDTGKTDISHAMFWVESPQGHAYWDGIWEKYQADPYDF